MYVKLCNKYVYKQNGIQRMVFTEFGRHDSKEISGQFNSAAFELWPLTNLRIVLAKIHITEAARGDENQFAIFFSTHTRTAW